MGAHCIKAECVAYRSCNPWGSRPYCEWASSKYQRLVWIERAERECGEAEYLCGCGHKSKRPLHIERDGKTIVVCQPCWLKYRKKGYRIL